MGSIPAISSSARGHAVTKTPFPLHDDQGQPSTGELCQAQPAQGCITSADNDTLDRLFTEIFPKSTLGLGDPRRIPTPQAGALTTCTNLPGAGHRPSHAKEHLSTCCNTSTTISSTTVVHCCVGSSSTRQGQLARDPLPPCNHREEENRQEQSILTVNIYNLLISRSQMRPKWPRRPDMSVWLKVQAAKPQPGHPSQVFLLAALATVIKAFSPFLFF